MEQGNNASSFNEIGNDDHLVNDILKQYTRHWKWFLIVIVMAVVAAHIYLRYTTAIYSTQATILLKDEKGNSGFSELSALEDLGIFFGGSGSKLSDQLAILNSRRLMEGVVSELHLNISYFAEGQVKTVETYNAPVIVSDIENQKFADFEGVYTLRIINNGAGSFRLKRNNNSETSTHKYGDIIDSDFGKFNVLPRSGDGSGDWDEVVVQIVSIKKAALFYAGQITATPKGKNTNVIQLTTQSPVGIKSRDILNSLVRQYNLDAKNDKNQVALNTANFIANRLTIISEELDSVETTKETFKKDNRLTDIPAEATIAVESSNALKSRILDVSTQIALAQDLEDYINSNTTALLPSNLGVLGGGLSSQVDAYNALILQRNDLLISSTEENPVVQTIDSELSQIRNTIQSGLSNERSALEITERELRGQERVYASKIATVPTLEKAARGIVRQQEIKEELYLYLLKKREETAISLAINTPNAKVIDEAITSPSPVSPKRGLIKLIAAIIGFLFVLIIIYVRSLLDIKLHSRSDVERLTKTPILGELPFVDGEGNHIIEQYDRSILAESFRILRTNLDYFTRSKEGKKRNVVYVTSTIKGEGKTFVAFNLSLTLASTGKKVLLIGGDIRNPQVHRYMDLKTANIGLSEYMYDDSVAPEDIITNESVNGQKFDVVLSGRIPPNPAELFMNSRYDKLIERVSELYDYVVVDTAPTMQVTDTLLISQYADVTIFVTRAEFTQKRLLQYSQDLYKEGKLKNMTYVVNGVKSNNFGYGAKYGYGYGNEEVGLWRKIKDFLSGKS
ncbi:polysaccharide biosynthesis tyrosine autokinase [Dokdonia sinensis]|uniref:non-specific protein-tyrosine kinase n=1 Tax=Dokdonia sinensis TaxID=2479847 RepID=A0A3M0GGZ9_9FLAO|nr:polysaccharide biosynthesis tyrosine autokinase [Dokdonia sinensis]RMB63827.1 polysaccharide biosynthesis tyrosine autokinase [Dokdonia sinensis]